MHEFAYENQGTETFLVYHLEKGETLDHFARGMLQSNEIGGIVKPAFTMRDTDQYLKYPVTSRLPLKEYIQRDMGRAEVLKLCQSFAETMGEIQEYMLSQDKLVFDMDVIFVDVAEKRAELIYLPIDEFESKVSVDEFLRGFLSHLRFRQEGDLSYVAKILHFLNQPGGMDLDGLKRLIARLVDEKEETRSTPDIAPVTPPYRPEDIAPVTPPYRPEDTAPVMPPYRPEDIAPVTPPYPSEDIAPVTPPYHPEDIAPVTPPYPSKDIQPMPPMDGKKGKKDKKDKDKKGGIFGGRKEKKKTPPDPVMVPGMETPFWGAAGEEREIILNVDENGNFLPDQGMQQDQPPKKGLFSWGKGKKEKKGRKEPFGTPVIPPDTPADQGFTGNPPVSPMPPMYPKHEEYPQDPVFSYTGRSDGREFDNKTVILGGGDDSGSTVILGDGGGVQPGQRTSAARLVRRRNGQSAFINKEVFHIGREGSFADFYIGDNPAIGSVHADIFMDGTDYYICDRNSQNHTYVNRQMVLAGQRIRLASGDVITLADEDFDFILQ